MNKYYRCCVFIFFLFNTSFVLSQWVQVNQISNGQISGFISNNDTLYVSAFDEGIFFSTDFGDTWMAVNIPNLHVLSFDVIGWKIIAGTYDGIYYSSNFGSNWEMMRYPDYQDFYPVSLIMVNNKILAGTEGRGIYSTTDLGLTWENIKPGYDTCCTSIKAFLKPYNMLITSIYREGIFISSDKGVKWFSTNNGLTNKSVTCFAKNDSIIYAGTDNGPSVFFSKDSARTWNSLGQRGLIDLEIISLSVGDTILVASNISSICCTSDIGNNWSEVNTSSIPVPPIHVRQFYCITIFGNYLFAGTSHGIWRCSLSQLTSVENSKDNHSKIFQLFQNFPNPFNPSTTISYQISQAGFVSLKVYDVLGKEVATLVNEEKHAGEYNVTFNGSNLSSGVYFYQLKSGNFVETKKLILVK